MNKNEYFADAQVAGFVDFFKALVFGGSGSFVHSYVDAKTKVKYEFTSLEAAFLNYSWAKGGYGKNKQILDDLQERLVGAIDNNSELDCLVAALKILEWGEVYRGSVGWLAAKAEKRELVASIQRAGQILTGDSTDFMGKFGEGEGKLRSDSGMTKIYALSGANSIIYDDRVGAALALMAKEYLKAAGIKAVPEGLAFMCKAGKKGGRNPSDKQYKFPPKKPGRQHALSNIFANWLVESAARDKRFSWDSPHIQDNLSSRMRAIEASLFMLGYAVAGDQVSTSINVGDSTGGRPPIVIVDRIPEPLA